MPNLRCFSENHEFCDEGRNYLESGGGGLFQLRELLKNELSENHISYRGAGEQHRHALPIRVIAVTER